MYVCMHGDIDVFVHVAVKGKGGRGGGGRSSAGEDKRKFELTKKKYPSVTQALYETKMTPL